MKNIMVLIITIFILQDTLSNLDSLRILDSLAVPLIRPMGQTANQATPIV